jgi:hypothetical protein
VNNINPRSAPASCRPVGGWLRVWRLAKLATALLGLVAALVVFSQKPVWAQTITASLSGSVTDATGAVIPGAKVVVTNESTNVSRDGTSNSAGFFNFAGLMPGSYTLTVSAQGMTSWKQTGIVLNSQDQKAVPAIVLKVGMAKQEVTVVAEGAEPILLSSGQSSTTLNNTMVSQLSVQGRDAAELIKLMPGMAINSGLNNTEWNSALTQINSGPIGAFAASGSQPNGGMQMVMNGSVITDAGNQGTQIANVNQDMTQEVTIQNASFDAEHAHGPVTFSATGKQGGSQFHGAAYVYTRNGSLNANNAYFNASDIAKPIDHYWYPGFNVGGPILLPHTDFNKGHDKAFFFFGFEHMKQEPVGTLHKYLIPTPAMMSGDFSAANLSAYGGSAPGYGGFATSVPCANSSAWNFGNFCQGALNDGTVVLYDASGNPLPAGTTAGAAGATIDPSLIDPNGLALMKMLAASPGLKMINPSASNPFNTEYLDSAPVISNNLNIRGDVNITENMHAFVSFTRQPETDINNIGVWWWSPAAVPYNSQMPAKQLSKAWSVGVTNTFSPTLVNEAVFGYAYFINPITLANPTAADPATYGYSVPLPPGFTQTNNVPQVPNIVSWCCGIESGGGGNSASATTGAGFSVPSFGATWHGNGDFGKDSYTPDINETLTWVKGSHTLKFGFFWAAYANVQTENCCGGGTAGGWDFDNYASNTSFNYYSDMLLGHAQGYTVSDTNFTDYVKYQEYDFFVQDSWKATPKLTLNFGVRFEHQGQWFPFGPSPKGIMVWDPNNQAQPYVAPVTPYNSADVNPLGGFAWNALDKNIPLSGWPTHGFFPDPRIGVAYDLFGNGKTVLRGGFGIYRSQVAYNDVTENSMLSAPLGTKTFTSSCTFTSLDSLGTCGAAAGALRNTTTFAGLMPGDNKVPYTETWNIMIDQRMPWRSMFEIQYQGNRSRNLLVSANGAGGVTQANINFPAVGSEFQADPLANTAALPNCYNSSGQQVDTNWTVNVNCSNSGDTFYWQGTVDATHISGGPQSVVDFRPYDYTGVYVFNHNSYANYNALMLQWMKQAGPVVFNVNYTWSHSLGIWDGNNDNGQGAGPSLNAFCLTCSYGPLAFNRAQIFNASYVFNLPHPIHGNRIGEGIVNGWQLSGDTQFQTGPPLQALTGGRLNASYPSGVSNTSVLGTDGIQLLPLLTCNPGKGLASGQYFNPDCFKSPSNSVTGGASTVAANGPYVWPNIPGPGFFNSDLGLYKNFKITERQGLQFRITAFNFLNHPLPQFNLGNDINLSFSAPGGGNTNANTTGVPRYKVGNRTLELALKYTF